jgi:hypothetical protein
LAPVSQDKKTATLLTLFSGMYIFIRGLDNVEKGLKPNKEKDLSNIGKGLKKEKKDPYMWDILFSECNFTKSMVLGIMLLTTIVVADLTMIHRGGIGFVVGCFLLIILNTIFTRILLREYRTQLQREAKIKGKQ